MRRLLAESATGLEPWPGSPVAAESQPERRFSATSTPTIFTTAFEQVVATFGEQVFRVFEELRLVGDHPE